MTPDSEPAEPSAPPKPEDPAPSTPAAPAPAPSAPAPASPSIRARLQPGLAAAWAALLRARAVVRRGLDRIDPCEHEGAEPLGLLPLLCLLFALVYSLRLYYASRFQPVQDLGHHVALSAVVADYYRPGSLYPALYEEPSPLRANTLLYFFAGYTGRLVGVTNAVRFGIAFYLAGVPLATAYALRVFGRSVWPALLSVVLVYNLNYIAGFANLLFALPFMMLLVPVYVRTVTRPTILRALAAMALFICVFLGHAQSYLWVGALLSLFIVVEVFSLLAESGVGWKAKARKVGLTVVVGGLLPVPSLALFYVWYDRTFGSGRAVGGVSTVTAGIDEGFAANYRTMQHSFADLGAYALRIYAKEHDLVWIVSLGVFLVLCVAIARRAAIPGRAVFEWMAVLTFVSYFVLPESMRGQEVIASRHVSIGLLFAPVFANPVRREVSRLGRTFVIVGILGFTIVGLGVWRWHLVRYLREDSADIECALDAAPPKLWLHLVKLTPNTSPEYLFHWKPTWHVEKFYMGDKFGQVSDNPAINSTSPIRYREGVDPHRITQHAPDWWNLPGWLQAYDLALVHGWKPRPSDLHEAKKHATRLRACGNWELWRKHGPWETGEAPISP